MRRRRWPGRRAARGALRRECPPGRPGSVRGRRALRAADRPAAFMPPVATAPPRAADVEALWGRCLRRSRRARRWTYFASNWANMLWNAQMLLARASGDAAAAAGVRDFLERWRQGRVVRTRARRAPDPARHWLSWQQRAATEPRSHALGWWRHVSSPPVAGHGRVGAGADQVVQAAPALLQAVVGLGTALPYKPQPYHMVAGTAPAALARSQALHVCAAARDRCATRGAGWRMQTTGARCATRPTARCWRSCTRSTTRPPRPRSSAGRSRSCGARHRGVMSRQLKLLAAACGVGPAPWGGCLCRPSRSPASRLIDALAGE